MKFTINTKEFKNVMQLVKTVADSSANAKVTAHSVCLLRAFPEEKELRLEFSLNGSFLTYTFEEAELEGVGDATGEARRSVDLSALSALKFSGATVSITLGKSKEGNTLEFSSGRMKGKLILSHQDIEKEVEMYRPSEESVELDQTFCISDFLTALSAHTYGTHQNALAAAKRPVKIYCKKGLDGNPDRLFFASRDRVVGAFFSKQMTSGYTKDFTYYVLPKPFRAVLDSLSQDVSPFFNFGISKQLWRINHGRINVWFPNIVQETNVELEELVDQVNSSPALTLKTTSEHLQKALTEIAPFTSGSTLIGKEDTPVVRLIVENENAYFTINTMKAKDVIVEIEGIEFDAGGYTVDPSDVLMLNSKYLSECVTALTVNGSKKEKEPVPLVLMWWPHGDLTTPTKGKTLCLKLGSNCYWIARVIERTKTV